MDGVQQNSGNTPHLLNGPTDQWQSSLEILERTKYQLYLILHTVKFEKDKNHNNVHGQKVSDCVRSLWETIKEIFNHVIELKNEESNCWRDCGQQQQQAGISSGSVALASSALSSVNVPSASMVSSTKDWHKTITHELRNLLIDKLTQAILPMPGEETISDKRVRKFIAFAQKSEEEIYEKANSKIEYYQLLAQKIYDIQNGLKVRRQKRKAEEMEMKHLDHVDATHNQSGMTSDSDSHDSNREVHQTCQQTAQNSKRQKIDKKVMEKGIVFSQKQLEDALLQTWNAMRDMPKGVADDFMQPVDTSEFPDYLTIVTEPMDLGTIKKKLTTGQYTEPWQYIDDVWLMFNNTWRYSKKDTYLYDCCSQLSEEFNKSIDPMVQALGYCCGQKYTSSPQTMSCYGKPRCTIARNAKFRCYPKPSSTNSSELHTLCEACFKETAGNTIEVQSNPINKKDFVKMINVHVDPDPLVVCLECGRKQHQKCALYHPSVWPEGFVCDTCLKETGKRRAANKFNAKNLTKTQLSIHMEKRVNNFLAKEKVARSANVHIRVVYSDDTFVKANPELHGPVDKFPYRSKSILVFQTIDGFDVCIFAMYVQEYGSECPPPNTRRVNIAYLDSVHFFKPKQFRTAVYHEIILGYLEYVKRLGYTMAHIWASPPRKGEDYIFSCHPPDQKIPTPKRLQDWYKSMFEKGITNGIVLKYNDIVQQANEDEMKSAAELPYFEGDRLLELEKENNPKNARKTKGKSKAAPKSNVVEWCDEFSEKMDRYKNGFFVARLHSAQSAGNLPPIQDPDPLIESSILNSRDSFFNFTLKNRYEFSSLQHAKYSCLGILYALHHEESDMFGFTCDHCKKPIEVRYHCTVCDDFDLCPACKENIAHEHPMEKCGVDETSSNELDQTNPHDFLQRWNKSLLHVCCCQVAQCPQPRCTQLKNGLIHMDNCAQKASDACAECKKFMGLHRYHAKYCSGNDCPIPLCAQLKNELEQKQMLLRIKQEGASARRAATINAAETQQSQ